jgi:hypothetical protein
LQDGELHNSYSSPNIFRMIKSRTMRWTDDIVRMERPKRRWEDNIKIALKDLGCEGVVWFKLAQDIAIKSFAPR